jgi:hypothetical protein
VAELAGVEQALDVLAEAKDGRHPVGALVGPDPLEGAETVVERVREDVDLRVVPIDELSVHPDLGDLLDHTKSPEGVGS